MQPNDVKLIRLTRNLISFTEEVAAFTEAEAKRSAMAIADARKFGELSIQKTPVERKRGRAAVVSWDLAHNPAGRAYVLYELLKKDYRVDLIGPMWSRYGSSIWAPLSDSDLNIRSFHCSNVSEFVPQAEILAASQYYDIVYVCKPRLPSLYLGALIKEASECPLILDVDDFELSFFKNESFASAEELKKNLGTALHEPFEELATRYAQTLIPTADAITVSNVALRDKFGGHIVRHARDEKQFVNSEERRQAARQRLGIEANEYALIFIGTPRPHKGVLDVAKALHELNDSTLVFHVVGDITDARLKQELQSYANARVVLHPNCAFNELPDLLAGADLVPLIQDVGHAISQYQIPAKVSDALSLGIPVVATCTPPLMDLIASGAIHATDVKGLAEAIHRIKLLSESRSLRVSKQGFEENNQERRNFVGELGMGVNRARLEQAINEAQKKHKNNITSSSLKTGSTNVVELSDRCPMPAPLEQMVALMRDHYRTLRKVELDTSRKRRGGHLPQSVPAASGVSRKLRRVLTGRGLQEGRYDIAFFWKQNDSSLYGRRSDMIAQELVRSGRVRKMVHFDAPVTAQSFNDRFTRPTKTINGQQNLVMTNLIDRQMGILDTDTVRSRTHVYSRQPQSTNFLGQEVLSKDSYVRYINDQLEANDMHARTTIAWFCPVIWDAPDLIKRMGFHRTIADLIDDQRAWDAKPDYLRQLDNCYRNTLGAADLVFANCESLAEAMQHHAASKIHVVPNGAERFNQFPDAPVPEALKDIKGPIVGYVGNLRDRIDWTLLHEVVPAMPDVSFVFFGPSDNNANAESLAKYDNVHVPGVVRYEELAFHLKRFDVGLVPHLNNQLTERMNPLKVYNYFAAGLPIVSSEVANLEDLGSALAVATTANEFITAIRLALKKTLDTSTPQWRATMDAIAWENRVGKILDVMDRSLHRKHRKSA